MSNLTAFLAENAVPVDHVKYVVSKRFLSNEKDEKGNLKPIEWEIKTIDSAADEVIRKDCTRRVPVPGKKNQFTRELDSDAYVGRLAVACTVFPNLNDQGLQDSYHVMGADALLKAMLTPGEYANYLLKIQEVCGFDVTLQDEVDEAKN